MSPRNALLAAAMLLFTAGCPKAPVTPVDHPVDPAQEAAAKAEQERQALKPKVAALSLEAESLLRDQDELVWKNWTEGQSVDIGKTYEGREKLFSKENVQLIGRLRELTTDPTESKALQHLHVHFTGEYLAKELSEVTDAIANLQASLTYQYEGKDLPYRDLERTLSLEPDSGKRHAIYEAATPAVKRLSESIRRKEDQLSKLLAEVGYPSYAAYGSELRETNLEELSALSLDLLALTDEAWRKVLSGLVQSELKLPQENVTRADLPRVFRPKNVDSYFPKDQVLPRVKQTLAGMGIVVDELQNVRIDAVDRKGKNPRALALPVVVPTDIRVSLKPAVGVRAQAQALHELGHAMHFASSEQKRFELGKLGNATVAEAMGNVFEDLLVDPVWLEQFGQLPGDKATDYLFEASAYRLFQVRRAAARIVFEKLLHEGGDAQAIYAETMSRAYGVPVAGTDLERAGVDREDFFESVDHLRAWILAGQIQGQLKGRFGPSWWNNAESGKYLKALWAKGNSVTADELAAALGDKGLKPDVLLLRLSAALNVPMSMPTMQPPRDGGTP